MYIMCLNPVSIKCLGIIVPPSMITEHRLHKYIHFNADPMIVNLDLDVESSVHICCSILTITVSPQCLMYARMNIMYFSM